MKEEDKNIGFFHIMANSHRRGNHITKMKINEVWVSKEVEMKQGIVGGFKTLPSNTREWRANLDGLTFQRITEDEVTRLEIPFTIDEVFIALSNLNGDKAPSPDGFTLAL